MTIVVIGAGPTGIAVAAGAATRGQAVVLLEAGERPGGLADSTVVSGYTFQRTGVMWGYASAYSSLHTLIKQRAGGFHVGHVVREAYIAREELFVPWPLHENLAAFGSVRARRWVADLLECGNRERVQPKSLEEELELRYGRELCTLFYRPYWDRRTAGLTPAVRPLGLGEVDPMRVRDGIREVHPPETEFVLYPSLSGGWGKALARLAGELDVRCGAPVVNIDIGRNSPNSVHAPRLGFSAHQIVGTLPLPDYLRLAKLPAEQGLTSGVLVVNIGAEEGPNLPARAGTVDVADSRSGFYQVDIPSNTVANVAPRGRCVVAVRFGSLTEPNRPELVRQAIKELTEWGWIGTVEATDSSWLPNAHVWPTAKDDWVEKAHLQLAASNMFCVGPYAQWMDVGIAESVQAGLALGAALRGGKV